MNRARLVALICVLVPATHIAQGQLDLLQQFEIEKEFPRQFDIAQAIAATRDTSVLPSLEPWLTHEDRHQRGNAAFIFARLGDSRGFDTIVAILGDYSSKRTVWKISSAGGPWVMGQIAEDRYYAAHLLGDLKDPRAIPILVPLLKDSAVQNIVPWSLGKIGDRSAIPPLIGLTSDPSPNMRVLAIYALVDLKASEALPRLHELLTDEMKSNFGKQESVAEAAQAAIAKLQR
jgi:HEAT repeat protein